MAYETGAAFVQILPSFKGFQQIVKSKLKAMGDVEFKVKIVPRLVKRDFVRATRVALKALNDEEFKVKITPDINKSAIAKAFASATKGLTTDAKINVPVNVDTKKSSDSIGAFAVEMRKRLEAALKALPTIEFKADMSQPEREIFGIRKQLQTLSNQTIGIDISAADAFILLNRITERLNVLDRSVTDPQIKADIASALGSISVVDKRLAAVDGRTATATIKVKQDQNVLIHLATLTRAVQTLAIPVAITILASPVASLISSLVALSGVLGLIPAAGFFAAASIAVLAVGLQGFGEAMKNIGDPAKFAEALKELSPAARQAAIAIRDIAPAWKELRLDVQEHLFQKISTVIRELSKAYLPVFKAGLRGVAVEMNLGTRALADFAKEKDSINDTAAIFVNIRSSMANMIPVGVSIGSIFKDIAFVGSQFLPQIAQGFSDAAGKASLFIKNARETGKLSEWIQTGIDTLKKLGDLVGNVGSIIFSVFKAANAAGGSFLDILVDLTQSAADFLNSFEGQQGLQTIFKTIGDTVRSLVPGLQAIGRAILDIVSSIGPELAGIGSSISTALQLLGPIVTVIAEVVGWVLKLINALGPIVPALLAAVVAWKAFGAASAFITGLGGKLTNAAQGLNAYGTAAAGASAKTGLLATAGKNVGNAITHLGNALPFIGIALLAIGTIFDTLTPDVDGWAAAIANGTLSVEGLNTKILEHNAVVSGGSGFGAVAEMFGLEAEAINGVIALMPIFGSSVSDVNEKFSEQIALLSPLEAGKLRNQLADQGWSGTITTMNGLFEAQQLRLEALTSAQLTLEGASLSVERAQLSYNEVLKKNSADSLVAREAAHNLAAAIDREGQAAYDTALANAHLTGSANADQTAQMARTKSILDAAAAMNGPMPPAMQKLINGLDVSSLSALGAKVSTNEFGQAVVTLPNGKPVVISAETATAFKKVEDFKRLLESFSGKTFTGSVQASKTGNIFTLSGLMLKGGGILQDIIHNAGGRNLKPLKGNVATTVEPNTWRVVGDNMKSTESYIPWNNSPRSLEILKKTAEEFGYRLEPLAAGGLLDKLAGGGARQPAGGKQTSRPASGEKDIAESGIVALEIETDPAKLIEMAKASDLVLTSLTGLMTAGVTPMSLGLSTTLPTSAGLLVESINTGLVPSVAGLNTQMTTTWQQTTAQALAAQATQSANLSLLQMNTSNSTGAMGTSYDVFNARHNADWQSMQTQSGNSVNTIVGPQMGGLRSGLATTQTAYDNTAGAINTSWARIMGYTGDPVRWTLNNPINRGIVPGWNSINEFFQLNKAMNTAPVGFATGGTVPGFGTGDHIPALLEPEEFVVNRKAARSVGLHNLERWHRKAGGGGRAVGAEGMFTRFALGGTVGDVTNFARAQHGKPYIWGGVGPGGYDCSGFMSALVNVASGRNPYSRVGTTGSMPWGGLTPGLTSLFGLGWFNGNPGHMAGTIAGTNVESGGSPSFTKFADGASGATHPQFRGHASVPSVGGRFIPGVGGGFDIEAFVKEKMKPAVDMASQIPGLPNRIASAGKEEVLDGVQGAIDYIMGPALTGAPFDTGGMLRRSGIFRKDIQEPERVLPGHDTEVYDRLLKVMSGSSGKSALSALERASRSVSHSDTGGDGASQPLIGSLTVMVPQGASANEVIDGINSAVRRAKNLGTFERK